MPRLALHLAALFVLVTTTAGCVPDALERWPVPPMDYCVAGSQSSCDCGDGATGVAFCTADGKDLGECHCPPKVAPSEEDVVDDWTGDPSEGCVPSCQGKECGSDGCGGSCGGCDAHPNSVCDAALGECTCVPSCTYASLGDDDGCGSPCTQYDDTILCQPCTEHMDCGTQAACLSMPSGSFCATLCTSDTDCPSSYLCFSYGGGMSTCVSSVVDCGGCLTAGCGADEACDPVQKTCIPALPICGDCLADWECGFGARCYSASPTARYCVPECAGSACPEGGTCAPMTEDEGVEGVLVCVPPKLECCFGADCDATCDPPCLSPLGICLDGTCVECGDDADCPPDRPICDGELFVCVGECPEALPYWTASGCQECLVDAHCPPLLPFCSPLTKTCEKEHCPDPDLPIWTGDSCVECLSYTHCPAYSPCCDPVTNMCTDDCQDPCASCAPPTPVCAQQVGGTWKCVECLSDGDCDADEQCFTETSECIPSGEGTCLTDAQCPVGFLCNMMEQLCVEEDVFACIEDPCASDADCAWEGAPDNLECDVATGCCFSLDGKCDDETMFCPVEGAQCLTFLAMFPDAPPHKYSRCTCTLYGIPACAYSPALCCPVGLVCLATSDIDEYSSGLAGLDPNTGICVSPDFGPAP